MVAPRARTAVVLTALLTLGLAGCGGPPPAPTDVTSDVDRQRAAYLGAEPLLQKAIAPPTVTPGVVHSEKLGWDRTEVTAQLYESSGGTGPEPQTVENEVARAAETLRQGGWQIHWEMCLPPPEIDLSGMVTEEPIPIPVVRAPGFEWLASAYKIDKGVSYWALVVGVLGDGTAIVQVMLRAPNARDEANLFQSPPTALAKEQGCVEDGHIGEGIEKAGTPTMIRDWWPFPGENNTRAPNQV